LIGELRMVRHSQGVSLRYGADWLCAGFALSEDLPLIEREFLPQQRETAVSVVDDARPDRWGERVIRVLDKPPRLAVLDFLFYAGDERFGALGVSSSPAQYLPRATGPLPQLKDVAALAHLVRQILAGEAVDPAQHRLISPGASMGGAHPKALLDIDGEPWLIKFNEPTERAMNWPLVEHASLTLAAKAGIRVAQSFPVKLHVGHALAVKRFDRAPGGARRHALSAKVALQEAGESLGYPELAQLLRRRGVATGGKNRQQMSELFRRMVFNLLINNTDGHEKNHVLLMTENGALELSPAFDVLPSAQALGYQQLRVGKFGSDATLDNALSECAQFGLKPAEALAQVRAVCAVVDGWQAHFAQMGAKSGEVELLAQQIDRPSMRAQRDAMSKRRKAMRCDLPSFAVYIALGLRMGSRCSSSPKQP
jgi:serine/threonine-protein kinase HipA